LALSDGGNVAAKAWLGIEGKRLKLSILSLNRKRNSKCEGALSYGESAEWSVAMRESNAPALALVLATFGYMKCALKNARKLAERDAGICHRSDGGRKIRRRQGAMLYAEADYSISR